jgi:hypothetical protein
MEEGIFKSTYSEEVYRLSTPPLIVISKRWNELSPFEIELLSKILQAIGLSLAAVQVRHQIDLNLNDLHPIPSHVIGFGVTSKGIEKNEVITTPHSRLVITESLQSLVQDEETKKKLWKALKQLFVV